MPLSQKEAQHKMLLLLNKLLLQKNSLKPFAKNHVLNSETGHLTTLGKSKENDLLFSTSFSI